MAKTIYAFLAKATKNSKEAETFVVTDVAEKLSDRTKNYFTNNGYFVFESDEKISEMNESEVAAFVNAIVDSSKNVIAETNFFDHAAKNYFTAVVTHVTQSAEEDIYTAVANAIESKDISVSSVFNYNEETIGAIEATVNTYARWITKLMTNVINVTIS